MRKINWSYILIGLIYIALGMLFIVRPLNVESALCYVLAIAVAVFGLLYLVGYFVTSASSEGVGNGFAIGVLMLMLAVFIVVKQDLIITLVPFLFGVMVMVRGLFTLQTAFRIRRLGFPMGFTLILGLLIMAFGLFIMLFPLEMGETLFIIIGCGLMAAGISGIIEEISVHTMHRKREHERERIKDMGPAIRTYGDSDDADDEADAVQADKVADAVTEAAEAAAAPAGETLGAETAAPAGETLGEDAAGKDADKQAAPIRES